MQDKPKRPLDQNDDEIFNEMFSVASSMECTGLIPSAPTTDAAADSYTDLYDIPLAKDGKQTDHGLQKVKQDRRKS